MLMLLALLQVPVEALPDVAGDPWYVLPAFGPLWYERASSYLAIVLPAAIAFCSWFGGYLSGLIEDERAAGIEPSLSLIRWAIFFNRLGVSLREAQRMKGVQQEATMRVRAPGSLTPSP